MRRRGRGQSGSRRIAGGLVAGLVGVMLTGIVAEGAARLAFPRWREFNAERFLDQRDATAPVTVGRPGFDGWIAQTNGDFRAHVRINAAGLRNDEPVEAADGRLWAVGEAAAFGWGIEIEDSFGAVAARSLGLPFYDIASPAADLVKNQALLARMPASVRPRAVVLEVSVETSLRDYDAPAAQIATAAPRTITTRLGDLRQTLAARSALYTLIAQVGARIGRDGNAPAPAITNVDQGRIDAVLASSTARIGQIRTMIPAEIPFVALIVPARGDLRGDNAEARALRLGLVERLTAQGLTVADPFDALVRVGEAKTHHRHDGRWAAEGHRVAGDAVAQALAPALAAPASQPAPAPETAPAAGGGS